MMRLINPIQELKAVSVLRSVWRDDTGLNLLGKILATPFCAVLDAIFVFVALLRVIFFALLVKG